MASQSRVVVVLALFATVRGFAADWEAEALRLRPAAVSDEPVIQNLAGRMKILLDAVPRATTARQADAARAGMRQALSDSLGYKKLPWPPDLRARTVSVLRRDGYRIEKVVFQGLPGEWIPAHLYLPENAAGRVPGVLFYNGHWFPDSKSRPDFQAFCINMAKFGFAVLNFEAFGQGERGLSWRDHRRTEGLLAGVAQQGFAVYDARAALEYLLTRREVDASKIGMTGASGGGFDTWMNAALDDRIKVAVPVVGTCNFYEQSVARSGRDWDPFDQCHYVPGLYRYANNHELVAMTAPKPVLIVSAKEDKSFPVAGVHEVIDYARRLYQSYGKPEYLGYSEDSVDGHGYQVRKREAAYGWFLRWLKNDGDGSPRPEPPTTTLPFDSPELRCLPPGENQAAGPAMIAAVGRLVADSPPVATALDVRSSLGSWPRPIPWSPSISGALLQRLVMPSEADLNISMDLLRPAGEARGLLVTVDDRGKEFALADPMVQAMAASGWAVLSVDPRGIGELASARKTWIFAVSLMNGENFIWRQSWDILRAASGVLAAPGFTAPRVALYARGHDAALAASYLIGDSARTHDLKLDWFVLRDGFLTWHDFLDRPKSMPKSFELVKTEQERTRELDREIPHSYIPFNAAGRFDIAQLLAAPGVSGLVVNPIDGDWGRKDERAARKLLSGKLKVISKDDPDSDILCFTQGAMCPGSRR